MRDFGAYFPLKQDYLNYSKDSIEATDDVMKAVVSWEGKLNNFFLKSLDLWQRSSSHTIRTEELGIADEQLLGALDEAKAQSG